MSGPTIYTPEEIRSDIMCRVACRLPDGRWVAARPDFTLHGYEVRLAPVSQAELRSMDLVRHIAATQSEVAR